MEENNNKRHFSIRAPKQARAKLHLFISFSALLRSGFNKAALKFKDSAPLALKKDPLAFIFIKKKGTHKSRRALIFQTFPPLFIKQQEIPCQAEDYPITLTRHYGIWQISCHHGEIRDAYCSSGKRSWKQFLNHAGLVQALPERLNHGWGIANGCLCVHSIVCPPPRCQSLYHT